MASKTIGFVFIDRFADWEYGLLAASAVEWFGASTLSLSPSGEQVVSASGFRLVPDLCLDAGENRDLDAIAVVGSELWPTAEAPDISALIKAVVARGGVVGGICAGTLPLARAGLFAAARHTSNGRSWLLEKLPGYAGAALYQDVPHAVADRNVVSAPGSAPGTFAHRYLETLFPEEEAQLAHMPTIFAREYVSRQSS
ncbi:glutamine amidotransferase [Mesorhizobium sp. L-8-10]|nr:glutamine amidotransferase [Mesorhizobium sp. L-8-3]BCH29424.1 glutamine amidotransferase [Mesorhizobium sp. L-8-10]